MFNDLNQIPLSETSPEKIRGILEPELKAIRQKFKNKKHLAIFYAEPMTKLFRLVACCGLLPDVRKRISEGCVQFNKTWTSSINLDESIIKQLLTSNESGIARQLDVAYKTHNVKNYQVIFVKGGANDYTIFIEINFNENSESVFASISELELINISGKVCLAILSEHKRKHASDWEKAVHELASPLDFIYSNSDFLKYYLSTNSVPEKQKREKLEDFEKIATLLINRLHQYRFAFAGTSKIELKIESFSLYELFMPITHLWYHDCGGRCIRFDYDNLKDVWAKSDRETITFIAFNLISNAVKYSHKNTTIKLYGKRLANNYFNFGVANFGIAIPEEERGKIFEMGHRTETAKKKDARGLGIGLNVCRSLCETLRGNIDLISGSGNPNIFEVELPNL